MNDMNDVDRVVLVLVQAGILIPVLAYASAWLWMKSLEYICMTFRITAAFREFLFDNYWKRWWGKNKSYDEIVGKRLPNRERKKDEE